MQSTMRTAARCAAGQRRSYAAALWLSLAMSGVPAAMPLRLRMAATESAPAAIRFREAGSGAGVTHASRVAESRPHESLSEGMRLRDIGGSGLLLSEVGLGTMMWGSQVDEAEAAAQLKLALDDFGVNWLDTAEMYPVPAVPETAKATEEMLGRLLQGRPRDEYCIATKVCGRSSMDWMRGKGETTMLSGDQVRSAVEGSLARLGTDYVDLLQLHWPDRYVPLYGEPTYDLDKEVADAVSFQDQLETLDALVKEGKVRHVGLSNETPFGVASFHAASQAGDLVKPVSVQQGYNLLNRNDFESGMVEACSVRHCDMGLLAYSPLAGGALSGKYILKDNERLNHARLHKYPGFFGRYNNELCQDAIAQYRLIASDFGVNLAQLSLAYVYTRPFVAATVVGASSTEQLKENILSLNVPMTEETEHKIEEIYLEMRDPSKLSVTV